MFGLGKFNLRLEAVLHTSSGLGSLRPQFLDSVLVGIDLRFELLDVFLQRLPLRVVRFRSPISGAQGSSKGKGDVVIGLLHCILGELLFLGGNRKGCKLARRLQQILIDRGSLLGRSRAVASESWKDVKGIPCQPETQHGGQGKERQS